MKVTGFTSNKDKESEIKKYGADEVSSSVDLESLKKLAGTFDIVMTTIYIRNQEQLIAH